MTDEDFFVGVQDRPELNSRPNKADLRFAGFMQAAKNAAEKREDGKKESA